MLGEGPLGQEIQKLLGKQVRKEDVSSFLKIQVYHCLKKGKNFSIDQKRIPKKLMHWDGDPASWAKDLQAEEPGIVIQHFFDYHAERSEVVKALLKRCKKEGITDLKKLYVSLNKKIEEAFKDVCDKYPKLFSCLGYSEKEWEGIQRYDDQRIKSSVLRYLEKHL